MKKIKVLIVDDSVLFRSQIQLALASCDQIEVVGMAANGKIAVEKLATHEVDLVTLDVEMPVMDGLETIQAIKAGGYKCRIIMFSSLTVAGADKTMKALSLGATDFVAKPSGGPATLSPAEKIREVLLPKVLGLFRTKEERAAIRAQHVVDSGFQWDLFNPKVLVIASSTGGPGALTELFRNMKEPLSYPILLAQHMPPLFTASLVKTLGEISQRPAKEAEHGESLKPNHLYIAPGDFHFKVGGDRSNPIAFLNQGPQRNYVRPCADFLFESATEIWGANTLGVVLTGMGRDGADGAKKIKELKGSVLIQSEESCTVFGMPGAVFENKNFDFQGTPEDIARKILSLSKVKGSYAA